MELRIETFRTKSELEVVRDFWSSAHTHRDADFEFYQFISELFPHVVRPHVIAVYDGGEAESANCRTIRKAIT